MDSRPPLTVVTDTPSSLVLMPSFWAVMKMLPPLMVRWSSLSRPSLSAMMLRVPDSSDAPSTFMDILE